MIWIITRIMCQKRPVPDDNTFKGPLSMNGMYFQFRPEVNKPQICSSTWGVGGVGVCVCVCDIFLKTFFPPTVSLVRHTLKYIFSLPLSSTMSNKEVLKQQEGQSKSKHVTDYTAKPKTMAQCRLQTRKLEPRPANQMIRSLMSSLI